MPSAPVIIITCSPSCRHCPPSSSQAPQHAVVVHQRHMLLHHAVIVAHHDLMLPYVARCARSRVVGHARFCRVRRARSRVVGHDRFRRVRRARFSVIGNVRFPVVGRARFRRFTTCGPGGLSSVNRSDDSTLQSVFLFPSTESQPWGLRFPFFVFMSFHNGLVVPVCRFLSPLVAFHPSGIKPNLVSSLFSNHSFNALMSICKRRSFLFSC